MFPAKGRTPQEIIDAYRKSQASVTKAAAPVVAARVASAAPRVLAKPTSSKPYWPGASDADSFKSMFLGGLGAAAGGIGAAAAGAALLPWITAGAGVGIAAPQIYDYFTKPKGAPPSILPQSILEKPDSAPAFNIGVNQGYTYRDKGTFGAAPKILGYEPDGVTPILEDYKDDGSWASKLANASKKMAWTQKYRDQKQAFETPVREATLGLPGRVFKNFVGDFALSAGTLPERLKGVASRTSQMPKGSNKVYGFLMGQNPEWMPNEEAGHGAVMELFRTFEPEGQLIEQVYGFARGVTGFQKNSPEQTLNYLLSDKNYSAGERANIISKFRFTGEWPSDIVGTPNTVDYIGAHLTDALNNAEATYGKLPIGEQIFPMFAIPNAMASLQSKLPRFFRIIPKMGKMDEALLPSFSILEDWSRIRKSAEHRTTREFQAALAFTNDLAPELTSATINLSTVSNNWWKQNSFAQSVRRGLISAGVNLAQYDVGTIASINASHGIEALLESVLPMFDSDNVGLAINGLLELRNYGPRGFTDDLGNVIAGTESQLAFLESFKSLGLVDLEINEGMAKLYGLKKGRIVSPINSTNNLIGRSVLANILKTVADTDNVVVGPKVKQVVRNELVDLFTAIRGSKLKTLKRNSPEWAAEAAVVDKAQMRLLDWAVRSTLYSDFKIADIEKFNTPTEWKQWQSFFAKWYQIGTNPGVAVRNSFQDITKLMLQDRNMLVTNNKQFMKLFRDNSQSFTFLRGKEREGVTRLAVRGLEIDVPDKPKTLWEKIMTVGTVGMSESEAFNKELIMAGTMKRIMQLFGEATPDVSDLAGMPPEKIKALTDIVQSVIRPSQLSEIRDGYLRNPNYFQYQPEVASALKKISSNGIQQRVTAAVDAILEANVNNPKGMVANLKELIGTIIGEKVPMPRNAKGKILSKNIPDSLKEYEFLWPKPSESERLVVFEARQFIANSVKTDNYGQALILIKNNPDLEYSKAVRSELENSGFDVDQSIDNLNQQNPWIQEQLNTGDVPASVTSAVQRSTSGAVVTPEVTQVRKTFEDRTAQSDRIFYGQDSVDADGVVSLMPESIRDVPDGLAKQRYDENNEFQRKTVYGIRKIFGDLKSEAETGSERVLDLSSISVTFLSEKGQMTFAEFLQTILGKQTKFYKMHGGNGFASVPVKDMEFLKSDLLSAQNLHVGKIGSKIAELDNAAKLQQSVKDSQAVLEAMKNKTPLPAYLSSSSLRQKIDDHFYGIRNDAVNDFVYGIWDAMHTVAQGNPEDKAAWLKMKFNQAKTVAEQEEMQRLLLHLKKVDLATTKGKNGFSLPRFLGNKESVLRFEELYLDALDTFTTNYKVPGFDVKTVSDSFRTLPNNPVIMMDDAKKLLNNLGVNASNQKLILSEVPSTLKTSKKGRQYTEYNVELLLKKVIATDTISEARPKRSKAPAVYSDFWYSSETKKVYRVASAQGQPITLVYPESSYLGMQPAPVPVHSSFAKPGKTRHASASEEMKFTNDLTRVGVVKFIERNPSTPEALLGYTTYENAQEIKRQLMATPELEVQYKQYVDYLDTRFKSMDGKGVVIATKKLTDYVFVFPGSKAKKIATPEQLQEMKDYESNWSKTLKMETQLDDFRPSLESEAGEFPELISELNEDTWAVIIERMATASVLAKHNRLSAKDIAVEQITRNKFFSLETSGKVDQSLWREYRKFLGQRESALSVDIDILSQRYKDADIAINQWIILRNKKEADKAIEVRRAILTDFEEIINKMAGKTDYLTLFQESAVDLSLFDLMKGTTINEEFTATRLTAEKLARAFNIEPEQARVIKFLYDNSPFDIESLFVSRGMSASNAEFLQSGVGEVKGFTVTMENGTRIIAGLKNSDVYTAIEEINHALIDVVFDKAKPVSMRYGITDQEIDTVLKWSGAVDGRFDAKSHDKLAKGMVSYFVNQKSPSNLLTKTFSKLKEWYKGLYKAIYPDIEALQVSADVRKVFDKLFTSKLREVMAEADVKAATSTNLSQQIDELTNAITSKSRIGEPPVGHYITTNKKGTDKAHPYIRIYRDPKSSSERMFTSNRELADSWGVPLEYSDVTSAEYRQMLKVDQTLRLDEQALHLEELKYIAKNPDLKTPEQIQDGWIKYKNDRLVEEVTFTPTQILEEQLAEAKENKRVFSQKPSVLRVETSPGKFEGVASRTEWESNNALDIIGRQIQTLEDAIENRKAIGETLPLTEDERVLPGRFVEKNFYGEEAERLKLQLPFFRERWLGISATTKKLELDPIMKQLVERFAQVENVIKYMQKSGDDVGVKYIQGAGDFRNVTFTKRKYKDLVDEREQLIRYINNEGETFTVSQEIADRARTLSGWNPPKTERGLRQGIQTTQGYILQAKLQLKGLPKRRAEKLAATQRLEELITLQQNKGLTQLQSEEVLTLQKQIETLKDIDLSLNQSQQLLRDLENDRLVFQVYQWNNEINTLVSQRKETLGRIAALSNYSKGMNPDDVSATIYGYEGKIEKIDAQIEYLSQKINRIPQTKKDIEIRIKKLSKLQGSDPDAESFYGVEDEYKLVRDKNFDPRWESAVGDSEASQVETRYGETVAPREPLAPRFVPSDKVGQVDPGGKPIAPTINRNVTAKAIKAGAAPVPASAPAVVEKATEEMSPFAKTIDSMFPGEEVLGPKVVASPPSVSQVEPVPSSVPVPPADKVELVDFRGKDNPGSTVDEAMYLDASRRKARIMAQRTLLLGPPPPKPSKQYTSWNRKYQKLSKEIAEIQIEIDDVKARIDASKIVEEPKVVTTTALQDANFQGEVVPPEPIINGDVVPASVVVGGVTEPDSVYVYGVPASANAIDDTKAVYKVTTNADGKQTAALVQKELEGIGTVDAQIQQLNKGDDLPVVVNKAIVDIDQYQLTADEMELAMVYETIQSLNSLVKAVEASIGKTVLETVDPANAEFAANINKFFNKRTMELNMTRAVAQRTGSTMVDNYIYNYGEKYNFDHWAENIFGYPLWYLRTFSDYPRQILSDPNYLAQLFQFNRVINSLHDDEENLPLWMRSSVPLNIEQFGLKDLIGTDTVYLPLLSQISPIESLLNGDFTNATREKSLIGSIYNQLYGWGPGPHALVPLALGTGLLALSKTRNDEGLADQAAQYFGYLGSQTRLLSSMTAEAERNGLGLPVSGGVSIDPLLMAISAVGAMGAPKNNYFRALMGAAAIAQFATTHVFTKDGIKFVGPVYDQRRVANVLTSWGNEVGKVVNGIEITPEILQDASIVSRDPYTLGAREEYSRAYAVWSAAVTQSRSQKLIPQLFSYFGGPGIMGRGTNEKMQEEMYNRVDALYDMQRDPAVNKEDYEKAWLSFSIHYPNFPVFSMFKKYGKDAFQVYAYSALSRVGRGASAKAVYDTVGLDYNVVNEFFQNKGVFTYGTDSAVFKEGISKLALLLQSPDMSTKEEWGEAGILYHKLQREMEVMYPGTTAKQDVYFDLETKLRPAFLREHLDLKTRMDNELTVLLKDPVYREKMSPYYVSIKDSGDFLKMTYMSRDPVKAEMYQYYLENFRDWATEKEKQFLADYDLFEFHRGYLKLTADLDNSIASLTSGLTLPKLPKVRVDSPELEAKKTIENALETLSQKNKDNFARANAVGALGTLTGTGTGVGGGGAGGGKFGTGAGADLMANWEYLYSLKAATKIGYVKELGDQLKYETLQPILNAVNGNPTAFLNALDTPLLSGKWTTFNDPLKWEENLVNYVQMLGGENLRSSMMLEVSRGSLDPSQMVWSKVIGTVKSLSDSEIGVLTARHPELRDLQQVRSEAREHQSPTLNALMDVVGASISIQEDGTISVSGETVKKDKAKAGGKKGDRLDGGDIEEYISKWSKHYYGANIEQLYDQYIMVSVAQGADAGKRFWKKYPQLAQYQAFSNKLWDRYKKNKSGPPTKQQELDEIIKGVGVMMSTSKKQSQGDKHQGSYSIMREIISNRKMYLPKSPIREKSNKIDGSMFANVIAVIKASNPNLAITFAEFMQANPVRRQAMLQSNPDLARYITQFTPEQLGDIEQSYNVGLEIGGQSTSRGGGVRVYEQRSGRTGL